MTDASNILGCFASGPSINYDASPDEMEKAEQKGRIFRSYIWGENGIDIELKRLKHEDYGKDVRLILFQFYLNPFSDELQSLKEIESYRKSEKSVGVPIIVTDDNFFNKSEEERYYFLKESILKKIEPLAEVVKKRKLDTKMGLLKSDLKNLLNATI